MNSNPINRYHPIIFAVLTSLSALAMQTPPSAAANEPSRPRVEPPIVESPIAGSTWVGPPGPPIGAVPLNLLRDQPQPRHQILRAPAMPAPSSPHDVKNPTAAATKTKRWVHPPYSSHRRRLQPAPARLPGGQERESWKSPYSYGYFGSSGTRHWSLHYGYRDRYTEWRLK